MAAKLPASTISTTPPQNSPSAKPPSLQPVFPHLFAAILRVPPVILASTIQHRMSYYGKIDFEKKREELNPTYLKIYDEENLFTFISWMIEYNKEHPAK